jgi:putative hydrolase of the HAD superfamily
VSRWQAVVFDLDDTLYPERDYVRSGFRAVAAWAEPHLGIPREQGCAELRRLFEQGVRGDTFDRWLASRGLDPVRLTGLLVQIYRDHAPELTPFPGARELLGALRRHCRLGLLTDGHLRVQKGKLEALGLGPYFDATIFADEWGRSAWKPSPIPFAAALGALGTEAARAVYVADNPAKDFLGARRSGLAGIRLRHPAGEHAHREPETPDHAPDLTVSSLAALEQILMAAVGTQRSAVSFRQEPAAACQPMSAVCGVEGAG